MEYAIEASPTRKKFIETLLPSMMQQLGLVRSKAAVFIKVSRETPSGMDGATLPVKFLDNTYIVLIKPGNLMHIGTTLAHELVHVRQMAKGILVLDSIVGHLWNGKRYKKTTKYLDQPWEVDALMKQEIVLRRALES